MDRGAGTQVDPFGHGGPRYPYLPAAIRSRVPAHEPDARPAVRRVGLRVDTKAAAPVDGHVGGRAGRQERTGSVRARARKPGLDQCPPDAAPLELPPHRDRVELPQRLRRIVGGDPTPELVVALAAVVGEVKDSRLVPRMALPRFSLTGW